MLAKTRGGANKPCIAPETSPERPLSKRQRKRAALSGSFFATIPNMRFPFILGAVCLLAVGCAPSLQKHQNSFLPALWHKPMWAVRRMKNVRPFCFRAVIPNGAMPPLTVWSWGMLSVSARPIGTPAVKKSHRPRMKSLPGVSPGGAG